jgi:hypothetical protein
VDKGEIVCAEAGWGAPFPETSKTECSPVERNIPPPTRLGLAAARASRASLNVRSCETDGTRDDADGESDCALLDWDVGSAGFVGSTISIGIRRRFGCTIAGDDTGEEDCDAVIFKACLINDRKCRQQLISYDAWF